ncbi:hypothetical protein VP1G_07302 [Cytospora mali]|uniref:G-protein coupled receptors family 2 profile 2 domain-containing protein n=1 Tax=Cytospora mali TaxID=578113 RepID=A0A194V823_CYTMA|nr:hypothetical protein VP1G_07302 [Valsa mali var. pyri (nom. inval.)]
MELSDASEAQMDLFSVIERICSVFSLVGCVFIIVTFCMSRSFHKPINRLVFYASLFMPADAFWSLAMAVNVYLTFYYKFDAQRLRKMEIPYLLFCYGIPFIIAFVYIFIKDPVKKRMYGNATLWCWVQQSWDIWRIITFYGPVWATICVTFFIYIRAGREIYHNHKKLHGLNYTSHCEPEPLPMNKTFSTKTTEVSVTSEIVTTTTTTTPTEDAIDLAPLGAAQHRSSVVAQQPSAYSVTISALPSGSAGPTLPTTPTASSNNHKDNTLQPRTRRKAAYEANSAAWQYTKCAILFFTAILVTWIPSTANRVYSVIHSNEISLPLEYMSAFVLPLQGFWNLIIYVVTSWGACKDLVEDVGLFFRGVGRPKVPTGMRNRSRMGGVVGRAENGAVSARHGTFEMMSRGRNVRPTSDKSSETESMEELAQMHGSAL